MSKKQSDGKGEFPLFFAFADGVFHYVCAECTALCCRGQGFAGSLRREMKPLLSLYPALGSAATSRHGDIISFATPSGRCHFLDSDNLCRIEKEHGKALKPGVCVLFPFNAFTRIGEVIAISPHFMCPLRLQLPARPGQVAGTHSSLEPMARESALLDRAYVDAHIARVRLHSSLDATAVLKREEQFRDACSAALGQGSFIEMLRKQSVEAPALDDVVSRAAQILGVDMRCRRAGRDAVDDLLLALASPLRLRLLHLDSEGILRVLALGEIVLRQVLTLSNQIPTLQGAFQIIISAEPALRLLARGNESLSLSKRVSDKSPPFGDPELTFAAFVALRDIHHATRIFEALEQAIKPTFSTADRSVLLNQLGSRLEHEIFMSSKGRATNRKQKQRASV